MTDPRPSPEPGHALTPGVRWQDYLDGLDPVWGELPAGYYQGPFLGNGGLAALMHTVGAGDNEAADRIAFVLGDSRVRDHQEAGGALFGGARLPIGRFEVLTRGDITSCDLRLSLWNAELSGTLTTTRGSVSLRAFVHAREDLLVITTSVRSGDEHVEWSYVPSPARSPRLAYFPAPAGLRDNPPPRLTPARDGGVCEQELACGGLTVTRWRVRDEAQTQTLLCTVAHSPADGTARKAARAVLEATAPRATDELTTGHRAWWHGFYPSSFISVPDSRLESFYWIQLYKMASATRADRPVMATTGPWIEDTPWPGIWWNLNVQLEYWPLYATGHTELDSLTTAFARRADGITATTPAGSPDGALVMSRVSQDDLRTDLHGELSGIPGADGPDDALCEAGNLTWALHNVWLAYRHTMDDTVLRDVLFPLLRRAIAFYTHFLTLEPDGAYHLPATYSPEYGTTRDCNYDLALIRWGCRTLLDADARLATGDPLATVWRDVSERLTAAPCDPDTGLRIGRDLALTSSHRHYSHLLWFYPLYQIDPTTPDGRRLLADSLDHWLTLADELAGFTYTGSASMYALLGDGDKALGELRSLFAFHITPNTMCAETGPVIETPLAAAQSLHDMLIQSWGGTLRVFPAVPQEWTNAVMHDVRTEGAFRVSAKRRDGRTRFIRIHSEAGEPCTVLPGDMSGPYEIHRLGNATTPVPWELRPDGALDIALSVGDDILIITAGTTEDLSIAPVARPEPGTAEGRWGMPESAA